MYSNYFIIPNKYLAFFKFLMLQIKDAERRAILREERMREQELADEERAARTQARALKASQFTKVV
jgi:hypothetical protein